MAENFRAPEALPLTSIDGFLSAAEIRRNTKGSIDVFYQKDKTVIISHLLYCTLSSFVRKKFFFSKVYKTMEKNIGNDIVVLKLHSNEF